MPCFSIRRNVINLEKVDRDLLAKALEALGYTVTKHPNGVLSFSNRYGSGYFAAGKLTFDQDINLTENAVKQAYSTQVVQAAAKKFGWQVKNPAANQFVAVRRS